MSAFLNQFINHKKLIVIAVTTVFVVGMIYGFIAYQISNQNILEAFQKMFYLKDNKYINQYQMYLVQNMIYILICTYLSSSYLGHIGILFFIFLKGIQLSFSLFFVFTTLSLSFVTVFIVILETIIEILFVGILSSMSIYLSLYSTLIAFFIEQNFDIKNTLNFRLNILITSLILLSLSLALRLYIVPIL